MKQGEVRWYTFRSPDKRRPVLILTRNSAIQFLNAVTIAPITTTIRDIPSEVFLSIEDGMFADCVVNFDHIQTVSQDRVGEWIATLSTEKMREVGPAICFALGLDALLSEDGW